MTYDELLREAYNKGLIVKEKPLRGNRGRIKGNKIAIKKDLHSDIEKACVLAEELGHYHTTVGDITDQSKVENRKQELKARRWAVKKLIRVEEFIDAFNDGVRNRAELAEFLEVTEEFIDMAIEHFKRIYGVSCTLGEYTIFFSPLWVYRSLE